MPQVRAPESIDSVAERFVTDLGKVSGDALSPWLGKGQPLKLTRRCPDCPRERRVMVRHTSAEAPLAQLGAEITIAPQAEQVAALSTLRVGERRCDELCCEWSLGLLDHGAIHLERACFERHEAGTSLSALTLVPAIGASLISAPVATLSLTWLGLYLLFFR